MEKVPVSESSNTEHRLCESRSHHLLLMVGVVGTGTVAATVPAPTTQPPSVHHDIQQILTLTIAMITITLLLRNHHTELTPARNRNRSVRRRNSVPSRSRFSLSTLRGMQQPDVTKRMNRIIKSENAAIGAYEKAGRERVNIAKELSDWGEATEDDAVSDITDKLGVLLAEMGDQEDLFAGYLEEYRTVLKHIRNTENSVQPSRNHRAKIQDEIAKLKIKDPESIKLETLEQELVRAEAQSLVAEAQLTNMTRSKLKEAFDIHLAAVIERGEKQILLAQHARRLLGVLDDSPVVPGEPRQDYDRGDEATLIISDAEKDLHAWESTTVPIPSSAGHMHDSTLLPAPAARAARESQALTTGESEVEGAGVTDSTRDIRGSVSETRYPDEYYPGAQSTSGYAAGARDTATNALEAQERAEPVAEVRGFASPITGPSTDIQGALGGSPVFIPGTKQRVDPDTGSEGVDASGTGLYSNVCAGAPGSSEYTSGAQGTSEYVSGAKEQVAPVSEARGLDESGTGTAEDLNGNVPEVGHADEPITDVTKNYEESSTEINRGTLASQEKELPNDVSGSILAEAASAREKLWAQPQTSMGLPQAVGVPY
ncbi:hypothetical protein BBP40_006506 [Aspergillus hancockii]|nr:hypothetical protein BBP40_006506 [Aspergillus hancockii]